MPADHVRKREQALGRWAPATFYTATVALWVITALQADAEALLWLVILPLPALVGYGWRTRRSLR